MVVLREFDIYKSLKNNDLDTFILNEKLQFKSNYIFNALHHMRNVMQSADRRITDNTINRAR